LNNLDRVFHLFLPHPSGYVFMYFLGFFILLLCLDISPWLALVGSLTYGFSSFFFIILEVGHNSQSNAIGYLAPLLGGIILLMRRKYWLGFAVTTLFMAMELNANHIQITYYGIMLFACVLITYFIQAIREKKLKPYFLGLTVLACASFIGFLPNAGSILATYEYGNYTTRGKTELTIDPSLKPAKSKLTSGLDKEYATQWSYGIDETFTLLIPDFKGGASDYIGNVDKDALKNVDPQIKEQVAQSMAYFGNQGSTSGPVYIGSIVILLAFLGIFIIDLPIKWALFAAAIISIMLAWGHNFMAFTSLFMDYFPGYNKFRSVTMILVIAEIAIPIMAVLALDKLIKSYPLNQTIRLPFLKKGLELKKVLLIALIVVGGFCLICYLMPTMVNTFAPENEEVQMASQFRQSGATQEQISQVMPLLTSGIQEARVSIFKSDAFRSFSFIILSSVIIFLLITKKIKVELFIAGIGILLLADLWPIAFRYLSNKNFVSKTQYDSPPEKSAADEQILTDKSLDYRVLNLGSRVDMDAKTSYYHKSIGGYHGAKLKKYHELMEFHLWNEQTALSEGLNSTQGRDSLLTVLFSKFGVLNMLNTKYIIVPTNKEPVALQNTQANGNAWFVKSVKTVANADSEIVDLYSLDTKKQALIQKKNKESVTVGENYDATGKIALQSYKPNDLVYETNSNGKAFAVFSEIYYPKGWNAYIDGILTPHTCVDYVLRGMEIPAGKHNVEFKFEPRVYKLGNAISILGSILVCLSVLGAIFFANKKKEFIL
jgi:hypothetical protein